MAELSRRGSTCVFVTSDSNHLAELTAGRECYRLTVADGVTVTTVRSFKTRSARSWRRVVSWLDFEWRLLRMPLRNLPRPDAIVVSSLSLLTILNGLRLRRRLGARLIFEVRDIWPLTLTEEGGFSQWNPVVRALGVIERWGYRSADAIVGTMPNLGEHVANVTGEHKDVFCIPMGVADEQAAAGDPIDDAVRDLVPTDKFLVTYAGTIGSTNALQTLMDCVEAAHAAGHADVHFLVVGDGDLKDHYIDQYGHLPNLTFLPKVHKGQVPTILALSDLLYFSVHKSKVWQYGQSLNKLIDYMAAGKPIVASYTGYPSMINEAQCGTFVPAGDSRAALREILNYRDLPADQRQAVGTRGRAWLLRHRRYPTLARQYQQILAPMQDAQQACRNRGPEPRGGLVQQPPAS